MRIPGGDLAPARRRRYGGSYGRQRRRRGRALATVVLLVAVGGGAFYVLHRDDSGAPARLAQKACPTATPVAATPRPPAVVPLLAPASVTVTVLNGTARHLLAKSVADALAADGFRITRQGNAPRLVAGASQVLYGPGASRPGRTVSAWVPGSRVVAAPRASRGSVQLVLGSSYTRLATAAEAAAAGRQPVAQAGPVTAGPRASAAPCSPS